ncbi:MAG: rfbC [Chitinophagaceae bacterium]|nr:rfbC [Chitinophagaceae bacterium]
MRIEEKPLQDCFIIHDTVYEDERGYFFESFNQRRFFRETGIDVSFVQDNQSKSSYGVLRGLHFQEDEYAQSKLVRVLHGEALDVAVDLRKDSPTFGKHFSTRLTQSSRTQFFIPKGFAHGFIVLSESCIFFYKCDNFYKKESEKGIIYDDIDLNIDWRIKKEEIIVSEKDRNLPSLRFYLNQIK